jgi:hypothetical protein
MNIGNSFQQMKREQAETLSLQILAHLLSDEAGRDRFLALSGSSVDDLRQNAGDPAFLAGVLDYYLANEADLLEMCEALSLPPDLPARARRELPGWTPL